MPKFRIKPGLNTTLNRMMRRTEKPKNWKVPVYVRMTKKRPVEKMDAIAVPQDTLSQQIEEDLQDAKRKDDLPLSWEEEGQETEDV